MKNEDIHDSQISATTSRDANWGASRARLDHSYAWFPDLRVESWLQVDLLRQTIVTGLITQGRYNVNQYLTGFKVITSLDGVNWENVLDADGEFEVGIPHCCLSQQFLARPIYLVF